MAGASIGAQPTTSTPLANGTQGTGSSNSSSSRASDGVTFGKNFNDFLTLLTNQLKHQDPLSPLDATQFTTQLVQFSSVEQLIKQNSQMANLIALEQNNQAAAAVSYLGKTVEVNGNALPLVNGGARFSYTLQAPSAATVITVADQNGRVVRTLQGATDTARHDVAWDGKDDNGNALPAGVYSVTVTAVDNAKQPVGSTTSFTGTVTQVSGSGDKLTLNVGGKSVAFGDIVSVSVPSSATTISSTSSSPASWLSSLLPGV